jgi:hypothetical protein
VAPELLAAPARPVIEVPQPIPDDTATHSQQATTLTAAEGFRNIAPHDVRLVASLLE